MRKAAQDIGKTIFIGAVMSESAPQSWWTPTATNWNTGLFTGAGTSPDFYIVHNYYTPYQTNASADIILATPESVTQTMMNYVKQSLTNAGIAHKPVILGEYNITSLGSKQQVSNVNGLHGVMVVGEALKNKIGMTEDGILQMDGIMVMIMECLIIGDEPDAVPKWNPRLFIITCIFLKKCLATGWFLLHLQHLLL
jgi:hypothetical protein